MRRRLFHHRSNQMLHRRRRRFAFLLNSPGGGAKSGRGRQWSVRMAEDSIMTMIVNRRRNGGWEEGGKVLREREFVWFSPQGVGYLLLWSVKDGAARIEFMINLYDILWYSIIVCCAKLWNKKGTPGILIKECCLINKSCLISPTVGNNITLMSQLPKKPLIMKPKPLLNFQHESGNQTPQRSKERKGK